MQNRPLKAKLKNDPNHKAVVMLLLLFMYAE